MALVPQKYPGPQSLPAQDDTGAPAPHTLDASGFLLVNVAAGGGAGGTSSRDESAFTVASSSGTPLMGVVDPVDTPADGTLAVAALDSARRLKVAGTFSATPVQSNAATAVAQTLVGTVAGTILASNGSRKGLVVQNTGTTVIKLGLGRTPTQTAYHRALPAGGNADDGSSSAYVDYVWTGAIQAISSGAGGTCVVTELT